MVANADMKAEVKVPRVAAVRVRNGRPVVAAPIRIAERSPGTVAGTGEEDARGGIRSFTFYDIADHAILRRPSPVAIVDEV